MLKFIGDVNTYKKCEYCNNTSDNKKIINYKNSGMYLCEKHYMQMRLHNKILEKTIYDENKINILQNYSVVELTDLKLNKVAECIIDTDSIDKIKKIKWHISDNGYVIGGREKIRMHRLLICAKGSDIVDHINGNRLDNRMCNLRIVTTKQNSYNKGLLSSNTSNVTGVHFHKKANKWCASITHNGKYIYLGLYKDKEEAIIVRKNAELKYFGKEYIRDVNK